MAENPIIAQFVAIAHLTDTDANLIIINETYMKGQFIMAYDDAGRLGMKVGDWDWENEPKSSGTAYVDLDWFINPADSGTPRFTPWTVNNASDTYSVVGGDTLIADPRLVGYADFPVWSTSRGRNFRPGELDYTANADGILKILDFVLDDADDIITIILPTTMAAEVSIADIDARLAALELFAAPFVPLADGQPSIAKVWWPGTIDTIPIGWRECEAMRGLLPYAQKIGDPVLGAAVGTPVGSDGLTIEMENLPADGIEFKYVKGDSYGGGGASGAVQFIDKDVEAPNPDQEVLTGKTLNMGSGTAINYKIKGIIGLWIEYFKA